MSPDHTFEQGLRQRPLGKKKIATWIDAADNDEIEDVLPNDEIKRNYQRNKRLIDLDQGPAEVFMEILKEYQNAPEGDRSKLLNYFITKRLRSLTESIGDF